MQVIMTQPVAFQIDPHDYYGSALGNALYSGLTLSEVFNCAKVSDSAETFDTAVSATIDLRDLLGRAGNQQGQGKNMTFSHEAASRRIDTTNKSAKPQKLASNIQIAMTIPAETNITVASHHTGDAGRIGVSQGANTIVLSRENAEQLIDSLNSILSHLQ